MTRQLPTLMNSGLPEDIFESPWSLYLACVIFGLSIASFLDRHRSEDSRQRLVFAIALILALVVASLTAARLETTMLVLVPCAGCFAMVASVVVIGV